MMQSGYIFDRSDSRFVPGPHIDDENAPGLRPGARQAVARRERPPALEALPSLEQRIQRAATMLDMGPEALVTRIFAGADELEQRLNSDLTAAVGRVSGRPRRNSSSAFSSVLFDPRFAPDGASRSLVTTREQPLGMHSLHELSPAAPPDLRPLARRSVSDLLPNDEFSSSSSLFFLDSAKYDASLPHFAAPVDPFAPVPRKPSPPPATSLQSFESPQVSGNDKRWSEFTTSLGYLPLSVAGVLGKPPMAAPQALREASTSSGTRFAPEMGLDIIRAKTPRGYHYTPEFKRRVIELESEGLSPLYIAYKLKDEFEDVDDLRQLHKLVVNCMRSSRKSGLLAKHRPQ